MIGRGSSPICNWIFQVCKEKCRQKPTKSPKHYRNALPEKKPSHLKTYGWKTILSSHNFINLMLGMEFQNPYHRFYFHLLLCTRWDSLLVPRAKHLVSHGGMNWKAYQSAQFGMVPTHGVMVASPYASFVKSWSATPYCYSSCRRQRFRQLWGTSRVWNTLVILWAPSTAMPHPFGDCLLWPSYNGIQLRPSSRYNKDGTGLRPQNLLDCSS